MAYFAALFCIFFSFYGWKKYKYKLNPLFVFATLWAVIFILSKLRLYYLKDADEWVYFVILIGIFSFGSGYILASKFLKLKRVVLHTESFQVRANIIKEPRYMLIYILAAVVLCFYIRDLVNIFSSLSLVGMLAQIRSMAQDSQSILYEGRSTFEKAARILILQPFVMALQPIVAIEFWTKSRRRWLLLAMDISIVVLRMFTDGSRGMLMYLGMHFFLIFTVLDKGERSSIAEIYEKYIQNSKKAKFFMRLILLIFGIVFIVSTMSRSGERFWRNLYYYFSMQPSLMTTWIDEISHYGYGMASLNGFVYPIIYFIKNTFGIQSYPTYWYENIFMLISSTDQQWVTITNENTFANAYVSVFWFPYLDGNIIGEILIMFLYGMIAGFMYKNVMRNRSAKSVCLYSYFMQSIIMSYVRFQYASETYALGLVFLYFILYKNKRSIQENRFIVRQRGSVK